MTADDFRAFFGIKVEYRRGVHQDRLSAQLLKYLVRQLIASHMRENQLVIDDTAQRVECVQHHVGRAVDVVAVSNINAGVCDNIQSALCRRLHNAQVTHVVKMNALIVGMELDSEQSVCFDEVKCFVNVPAVGMNRTRVVHSVSAVDFCGQRVDSADLCRRGSDGKHHADIDVILLHGLHQGVAFGVRESRCVSDP